MDEANPLHHDENLHFEKTIELYVVPKPRAECTKGEQLVVTFGAGYIAGVFCAIVSHPADTLVSKLNQAKGASAGDIVKKLIHGIMARIGTQDCNGRNIDGRSMVYL
ncbi:unnamed protein product [Macrosiphum euphorbiae]|uniref:Uncharacterized protein n=1 Tax=Macrosiphum euphorbiae TaxID=13131 RepID=A0AAV0WQX6_9HEMI|nr:unnamed protein product [Macrosiphum euphorbiae]